MSGTKSSSAGLLELVRKDKKMKLVAKVVYM